MCSSEPIFFQLCQTWGSVPCQSTIGSTHISQTWYGFASVSAHVSASISSLWTFKSSMFRHGHWGPRIDCCWLNQRHCAKVMHVYSETWILAFWPNSHRDHMMSARHPHSFHIHTRSSLSSWKHVQSLGWAGSHSRSIFPSCREESWLCTHKQVSNLSQPGTQHYKTHWHLWAHILRLTGRARHAGENKPGSRGQVILCQYRDEQEGGLNQQWSS